MGQFLSEALKTGQNVQLSEALKIGGMVTGIGLGIVFGVLVLLMLVLILFKLIFYRNVNNKTKDEKQTSTVKITKQEEVPDDEIVAAMVAAIAESTGSCTNKIRIKSIKKVN